MKGRILRASQRAKQIEARKFTEKDLRGLTGTYEGRKGIYPGK